MDPKRTHTRLEQGLNSIRQLLARQGEQGTAGLPATFAARIRIFNLAVFCNHIIIFGYIAAFIANGLPSVALALMPNLIWHSALPFLMRRQKLLAARTLSLVIANITVFAVANVLGRQWGVQLLFFALVPIPLSIYEARERIPLLFTLCLPAALETSFELCAGPGLLVHAGMARSFFTAILITTFVMLLLPIWVFLRKTFSYQAQLQAANAALEQEVAHSQQLESELENGRRVAALGELAAGVAHEINTPLQYVTDGLSFLDGSAKRLLNFAETVEAMLPELDEKQRRPLQDQIKRLKLSRLREEHVKAWIAVEGGLGCVSEIVVAMKALASTDEERREADVNEIVRNAALVTRGQWNGIAELSFALDDSLPLVPVVAGELGQVFINLIINAAHAIADTGRPGTIHLRSQGFADRVEIEVRDNGCGIADAIKDRVFEPFFTTKEVGRGSGQGLSLAYTSVAQRHGGRLSFESAIGIGTTFRVVLPIQLPAREVSPSPSEVVPDTGRASGLGLKILGF